MRGRGAGILLLVVLALLATLPAGPAEAAITTPFTARFEANANGSILLRGNANLTCLDLLVVPGCPAARTGSGSGDALNNNGYPMVNADADGDPATFNDSTATVTMPPGSTVLFAGLYWGADPTAGSPLGGVLGTAAPSPANRGRVLLRTPAGTAWNPVTASTVTAIGTGPYQGFADVTALVAGAGNGTYGVANIQTGQGADRYAGWTLVIAYQNLAEDMRSLRVYDGFGSISTGSVSIPVTGFETPHTGTVRAKVGAVAYEGDLGRPGDALRLDGQALSDAANPANNVFNSTVSEDGAIVGGRNPDHRNLLGIDIDQIDATGLLDNAATSATLTMTTGGETYYPGVITFTIDLYAPRIVTTMTGTDVDGGLLLPGDEIEYRIAVRNDGSDTADGVVLSDAVPTYTGYVPGSMTVGGSPVTDAADGDGGRFDGGNTRFALGSIPYQGTAFVTFRVRVALAAPAGYAISNLVNVSYLGRTTGVSVAAVGGTTATPVLQPTSDRAAQLSVTPSVLPLSATPRAVTYQATVRNLGPQLEPAARAELTLPAGVTPGTLPAGCTSTGTAVSCALGPLLSGHRAAVSIPATADATAAVGVAATVTAAGAAADPAAGNDSATATLAANSPPDAVDDSATTTNGTPVPVGVLANDSDPEDPAAALTVSIGTPPGHGTAVVVEADRTITYTPALGWAGVDTFGYELDDGNGGRDTATVTVTTANAPPVANDDTISTPPGTPVSIAVLANDTDPNGDPRHLVSVGQPQSGAGTVTSNADRADYVPAPGFAGRAAFSYTVGDSRGAQATATVYVDVANSAPTAADDAATTPYRTDVVIDALANDTDPNLANPHSGEVLSLVTVGTPAAGTATIAAGRIEYRPPVGYSGTVTFPYTIEDVSHATSTATVTVTVGNAAPVAADRTESTPYATPVDVDVLTHATDPNGSDVLRVSGTTNPAHGTATVRPDGRITYVPDQRFSGTDTVDYTIDDGHGGTDTGRITISVANAAPTARPDAVTVPAGVPLAVDVMANDEDDPNGDPVTVTVRTAPLHGTATVGPGRRITYRAASAHRGADSFGYELSDGTATSAATVTVGVVNSGPVARTDAVATDTGTAVVVDPLANDDDPNGDALTLAGVTAAGHGTVARTANGTVTYTPVAGFWGIDAFSYTVEDPERLAAAAMITVLVRNADPIARDDAAVVPPGVTTVLDVLADDTDPNTGQVIHVASAGVPGHGTAVVVADRIRYTPAAGYHGPDTFGYVVTDDLGATDTGLVTLTVDGPPVTADDEAVTASATAVTVAVTANDTDPEGQPLTVTSVAAASHGSAVLLGGQVRYTPAAGFIGTDSFGYVVRDPVGNTATGAIRVHVANSTPVARPDLAAAPAGRAVTVPVLANDDDPDAGQVLHVASAGTAGHGTTLVDTGGIRYTSAAGHAGPDTFTYVVADDLGATATGLVTVTVDGAPIAADDDVATASATAVSVDVTANDTDPEGQPLVVVSAAVPAHGDAAVVAGAVRYTPAAGFTGTDAFTYVVRDPAGSTAVARIRVRVANADPVARPDEAAVLADRGVTVDVLGNDSDDNPGQRLVITAVGTPAHGAAAVVGGRVRYTPATGWTGRDGFTYRIADGAGGTAQSTVAVTVAGGMPVALPDAATTPYRRPVEVPVLANDLDPGRSLTLVAVTAPPHGTAAVAGDAVAYTPPDGFSGVAAFRYTAVDDAGHRVAADVAVTVGAPPVVPDRTATAKPGEPVGIPLPASETGGRPVTVVSVGRPSHGTARLNADGTVTYVPARGFHGTDTFTYVVVDADGNRAEAVVTVVVGAPNRPPRAVDDTVAAVAGDRVTLRPALNDTDPDGDPLAVVAVGAAAHGTATRATDGTVVYTPARAGADSFAYTVADGRGGFATATVTVRVSDTAKLPVTGANVLAMAGAGALAVAAGAVVYRAGTAGPGRGRHRSRG